ncbi:MAG: LysR family transcriptional regulator, partial [Alphaproteobacteria bacterium HGW-Alphaproteobacteria-2]
ARFEAPPPARTIGMVWRRATPLGARLGELAETVFEAAATQARGAGAMAGPGGAGSEA